MWFKYFVVFNLAHFLVLSAPSRGQGVIDSCANYTWRLLTARYRTYTKLPFETPVRVQCGSTCWANAIASYVELLARSQNEPGIRPSVDYMLMSRLSKSLSDFDFHASDFTSKALARIRDFGLLNESQWPQKFPLEERWDQLMDKLESTKQDYLRRVEGVRSSNEVGTKNLTLQLLKNKFEDKLSSLIQDVMGEEFIAFMQDMEIRRLAHRTIDPLSSVMITTTRYTRIIEKSSDVMNNQDAFLKPVLNAQNQANLPMMMEIIKKAIDNGLPVLASVYWIDSGRIAKGSILHSTVRMPFGERGAGHAVTVVGYREDGILIQNSFGPERGDKGYFELTTNYLQKNLSTIIVPTP